MRSTMTMTMKGQSSKRSRSYSGSLSNSRLSLSLCRLPPSLLSLSISISPSPSPPRSAARAGRHEWDEAVTDARTSVELNHNYIKGIDNQSCCLLASASQCLAIVVTPMDDGVGASETTARRQQDDSMAGMVLP